METNTGWPDPTEWVNRLQEGLDQIGADYIATPWTPADDPEEFSGLNRKQGYAAEALIVLINGLRELPVFEESTGVAVLHDLVSALNETVHGGHPRLFDSVKPGKRGGQGLSRTYLKSHVVLAVRFLVETHPVTDSEARHTVAKIFAEAGATGRKGRPLSASTVQDWCEKATEHATEKQDLRVHNTSLRALERLKSHPEWPGDYQHSVDWIFRMARDPLLASKYG